MILASMGACEALAKQGKQPKVKKGGAGLKRGGGTLNFREKGRRKT